jgi:hypothetical protein
MGLFNQFLRRNVAQRAMQRLVDTRKRVKQDIVRDHKSVLRSLRLLLSCRTNKIQRSGEICSARVLRVRSEFWILGCDRFSRLD